MTLLEAIRTTAHRSQVADLLAKHYGPGDHPSGSPQSVHGANTRTMEGFDTHAFTPDGKYVVYRVTERHGYSGEIKDPDAVVHGGRNRSVTTNPSVAQRWKVLAGPHAEIHRVEIPKAELAASLFPGVKATESRSKDRRGGLNHEAKRDLTQNGIYKPLSKRELLVELLKHTPGGHEHDQKSHGRRGNASDKTTTDTVGGTLHPDLVPQSSHPDRSTTDTKGGALYPGTRESLSRGQAALAVSKPPPESPDLVRSITEDSMMKYGARIQHIAEVAGINQTSVPGLRKGIDTKAMYGNWDGNEFQGYTPERIAWQSQVLSQMEVEQIAANDGRLPGSDKQVIIMAGLPGSGKTHLLKNVLQERFDLRDYVVVNADAIKEKIIFDDGPPAIEDLEGMELSSMVHEESSDMSKVWEQTLIDRGANIALDITAANGPGTLRRIDKLKAAGYTVHVVHSDINPDEAIASTMRRSGEGSLSPGKVGRPVPPEFIHSMTSKDGSGTDVIDSHFIDYVEAANGQVAWYRNYPLSQQQPVLIYESASPSPEQVEEAA